MPGVSGLQQVECTPDTPDMPQVIRPRLRKYLAGAFFMLNCVYAATLPSAPAPKFEADKTTVPFATLLVLPPSALIALTLALFP